jgi:hypothetical protein
MDPLSILSAVGTVVGAIGAISQGQAAASQANTQAKLAKQQAEYSRLLSARDEEDYRRRQAALMATRRALMGGAGVDPNAGSPLLVDQNIAGEIEYQALKIRSGGEAEATSLTNQARMLKAQAKSSSLAGFGRAGATLLSGATAFDWGGSGAGMVDPYATKPGNSYLAGPI